MLGKVYPNYIWDCWGNWLRVRVACWDDSSATSGCVIGGEHLLPWVPISLSGNSSKCWDSGQHHWRDLRPKIKWSKLVMIKLWSLPPYDSVSQRLQRYPKFILLIWKVYPEQNVTPSKVARWLYVCLQPQSQDFTYFRTRSSLWCWLACLLFFPSSLLHGEIVPSSTSCHIIHSAKCSITQLTVWIVCSDGTL